MNYSLVEFLLYTLHHIAAKAKVRARVRSCEFCCFSPELLGTFTPWAPVHKAPALVLVLADCVHGLV